MLAVGFIPGFSQVPPLENARQLYQSTRYTEVLDLLKNQKDVPSLQFIGRSWFMLGEFKKASDAFEKALSEAPADSDLHLWLGRAYGRRAETTSPLLAPRYASRARQHFEKAVELNPRSIFALNDLFEYYLQAPGFLGGGKDKASSVARRIAELDSADGFYATARLAEVRKEYGAAEQHLRRAIEAAPKEVGRILDLARFLAKQGRHQESETEFLHAENLAPNSPKILFEKAASYIETRRNLQIARSLLKKYLDSPLTPDDPPRREAERLLRDAGS